MRKSSFLFSSLWIIGVFVLNTFLSAQSIVPYKNKTLPTHERVKDLLSRMTIEEKFFQLFMIPGTIEKGEEEKYRHGLFGFQVSAGVANEKNAAEQILQYNTQENALGLAKKINQIQQYFVEKTRLGIPMIPFDEALHGLVRDGATVFPQSIGLAASWNIKLMGKVADAIAKEASIRGIRQVLSPVINIATDVRWGRTEETYGEDPFLTSAMGVVFIKAFEKKNIITTPKHFIANVGDGGRDSYPIYLNERALMDIHYPPFIAAIHKAGARSIMTSYNSVDGSPATAHYNLLTETLKNKWRFKGFVISDASAVGGANVLHYTAKDYAEAGKAAITNGLDVIFQTQLEHHRLFIPPFLNHQIAQTRIDDAVSRVLTAKFELGLFDQPYVDETKAADISFKKEHQQIAKQAALESIVLLKNKAAVLPLNKKIQKIAVIGQDGNEARLGGYSGNGSEKISLLKGLQSLLPNADIQYTASVPRIHKSAVVVPDSVLHHLNQEKKKQQGLHASYFNNIDLSGKPIFERTDQQIDFHWTLYGPDSSLSNDFYSVRWTGTLTAPSTGKYKIGLEGNDGFRLYMNQKLVIDQWDKQSYHSLLKEVTLQKDSSYPITIEFKESNGNAHIRLMWNYAVPDDHETQIQKAVDLASKSDIVIIAAGIEEGEFRDRASLQLPGYQEALIQRVAETGKKVIVLLTGGSAITMNNWLDKVDAVLETWYPGEQGGHAMAAILFGDYNPSGKLPITFPINEAQLPLVYNHAPTGRGDDYVNLTGLPLFPFGYGLSYTQFNYSDLKLERRSMKKSDSIWVSCAVTNSGTRDGDEVVQLYIRDLLSSIVRPVMELKGFERIHIKAGETKQVRFLITPELLTMTDLSLQRIVEPGDFRVMIGSSSRDIRLKGVLQVTE
jgi:beta-glucosidase